MPALGTVNTNETISSVRLGAINSRTTVGGSDLGTINSTTSITIDSLSVPSFASVGTYQSGLEAYVYLPRGHTQAAAGSLPVMIVFGGYGVRDDWSARVNASEGIYYYLNNGAWNDLTYGHIVAYCQYTTGDPTATMFDNILTKLTAIGAKYDPNRISYSGLSGGAIGAVETLKVRYSQIACVIPISGPNQGSDWDNFGGIGFWQFHGGSDGTFGEVIGGTLYNANGASGSWRDLTPAPRATYYFGLGHSSSVWSTHVYNPATAEYNFFQFAAKFNKDATLQATQFVDNAEATEDIVDYRESKTLVDALSSGSPKTALLARLATLLSTIDQGGNRYIVSLRTSGSLPTGYNVITSFTTGSIISNIVDVNNGSSTVDFEITQETATGTRSLSSSSYNANKMRSHGFDTKDINEQGAVVNVSVNNGVYTIKGIPSGKHVDIFIYTHHTNANDDQTVAMTTDNTLQVVCNSVTTSQYVAYNNYRSISFLNVPESSGNITMAFDASGRDALVTAIEFLVR